LTAVTGSANRNLARHGTESPRAVSITVLFLDFVSSSCSVSFLVFSVFRGYIFSFPVLLSVSISFFFSFLHFILINVSYSIFFGRVHIIFVNLLVFSGSGECHLDDLTCTSKNTSEQKRCRSFRGMTISPSLTELCIQFSTTFTPLESRTCIHWKSLVTTCNYILVRVINRHKFLSFYTTKRVKQEPNVFATWSFSSLKMT